VRTALSQFGWWATPEDAAAYLETAPKVADNHGDRIAAERRASSLPGYELPVPMPLDQFTELLRRRQNDRSHRSGSRA
jgi:hypothetical protein